MTYTVTIISSTGEKNTYSCGGATDQEALIYAGKVVEAKADTQCLEHDVCTQAPDLDTLHRRIRATLQAEHDGCVGVGDVGIETLLQAPERFFEMWDQRAKTFDQAVKERSRYEITLRSGIRVVAAHRPEAAG